MLYNGTTFILIFHQPSSFHFPVVSFFLKCSIFFMISSLPPSLLLFKHCWGHEGNTLGENGCLYKAVKKIYHSKCEVITQPELPGTASGINTIRMVSFPLLSATWDFGQTRCIAGWTTPCPLPESATSLLFLFYCKHAQNSKYHNEGPS